MQNKYICSGTKSRFSNTRTPLVVYDCSILIKNFPIRDHLPLHLFIICWLDKKEIKWPNTAYRINDLLFWKKRWSKSHICSKANFKNWINVTSAHSTVMLEWLQGLSLKPLVVPVKASTWMNFTKNLREPRRLLFTSAPHQIRQLNWPQICKSEFRKYSRAKLVVALDDMEL